MDEIPDKVEITCIKCGMKFLEELAFPGLRESPTCRNCGYHVLADPATNEKYRKDSIELINKRFR